jgi:hypothetical protein
MEAWLWPIFRAALLLAAFVVCSQAFGLARRSSLYEKEIDRLFDLIATLAALTIFGLGIALISQPAGASALFVAVFDVIGFAGVFGVLLCMVPLTGRISRIKTYSARHRNNGSVNPERVSGLARGLLTDTAEHK